MLEDTGTAGNGQFNLTTVLHRHTKYIIVVTTYKAAIIGTFSFIVQRPPSISFFLGK